MYAIPATIKASNKKHPQPKVLHPQPQPTLEQPLSLSLYSTITLSFIISLGGGSTGVDVTLITGLIFFW